MPCAVAPHNPPAKSSNPSAPAALRARTHKGDTSSELALFKGVEGFHAPRLAILVKLDDIEYAVPFSRR